MSIIAKYLFKNILAKPFRTLILIFCIMCSAFVASLSLDMMSQIEFMMRPMLSQITGTSDMWITFPVGVESPIESSIEAEQLLVKSKQDAIIKRYDDSMYLTFQKKEFQVSTFDYELAYQMNLLTEPYQLSNHEAVITKLLAMKSGWQVGDTIELINDQKELEEFKVVAIAEMVGFTNGRTGVLVSEEGYQRLTDSKKAKLMYVNVIDDEQVYNFKDDVLNQYYNANPEVLYDDAEMKEQMKSFQIVFLLIFSLCILLVVFVVISVSSRIVCERMSVVGTFRSLGLSSGFTTKMLILENALYGLIGGSIGVLLYCLVREPIYGSMLSVSSSAGISVTLKVPMMSPLVMIIVLLISIGLMCACPLKEIIKTSRMPIRDIIFDNKDTEYKYNSKMLYIGIAGMIIAIICLFIGQSAVTQIASFALSIIGVSMVFPFVLKLLSGLVAKHANRMNMPVLHLAANSVSTKKSTVGSSVLCFTASALAIMIFIFISMAGSFYEMNTYNCDLIVNVNDQTDTDDFYYVDTLPGVTGVERVYEKYQKVSINGTEKELYILGLNDGGFTYVPGIKDAPSEMGKFEIYMDKGMADRNHLSLGDEVEITFALDEFLPITETLTLAGYIDSSGYYSFGEMMLISKELYLGIYKDYASDILIECESSEQVDNVKELVDKYSGKSIEEIQTRAEYDEYWRQKGSGLKTMLFVLIMVGIGLTGTGMISNQLIGFEGRKRECAVMLSTSMTRGKLSKLFILESMVAAVISLITALPVALFAIRPFTNVLMFFTGGFKLEYHVVAYLIFMVVLGTVFTLVALFPIKEIRKMKIANQLKYE